jgi:hypothetical protein
MFLKNKKLKVEFTTHIPGLVEDPEIHPQPAKNFYPSWWSKTPHSIVSQDTEYKLLLQKKSTIKACPSFPQYFSQGYVIPAWCDMKFIYSKEQDRYEWDAGRTPNPFSMSIHYNPQFLDHTDFVFQGETCNFIFKADSPWRVVTPKGYSVLQLPLFYHFNQSWTTLPGIIDTDVFHEVNIQIAYFKNNEEVVIKKGTPLAHYIVFKRSDYLMNVKYDAEFLYKQQSAYNRVSTKFKGGYLKLKRDDK